jgi:hypothetical protein
MPRTSQRPKEDTFNFRVDPALKAEFQAATEAQDKPAAQVLRDFMRAFVERRRHQNFAAEAHRQSTAIAARAADPASDEAAVMRELDGNLAGLVDDWK